MCASKESLMKMDILFLKHTIYIFTIKAAIIVVSAQFTENVRYTKDTEHFNPLIQRKCDPVAD